MKLTDSRLLAIIACLLWSTAFLGIKTGLQYLSPLLFAGIRFFLAGVAVAFVSRKPGYWHQIRSHFRTILLVGLFQTFMLYSFFYLALDNMRGSTGAIVNGMGPLVTALIAHFFLPGDRLNARRTISMILGVFSVFLITWSGVSASGTAINESRGIALMMFSLVANAAAMVLVAKTSDELDPFILNSAQLMVGGIMLVASGLVTGLVSGNLPDQWPPFIFYMALIWLVCVSSIGFSIWYYLLKIRKEPVSHVTVWKFLVPVSGSILSWIFMKNDSPDFPSLCGMVLTAIAITLFYSKKAVASNVGKKIVEEKA